jgi:ribulose-5-phosphate 4-epimerase/fuculose-1-phosphate aldolase
MVEYCRKMASMGYAPGNGGNASIRVPEGIWITAGGASLSDLQVKSLILVDGTGNQLKGHGRPSKELSLHLGIYNKNPRVKSVFHFHPPYSIAAGSLFPPGEEPFPAMMAPYIMQVKGITLLPFYWPGSLELAEEAGAAACNHQVVLLQNHGLLGTGETVEQAVQAVICVEENARVYILSGGHGTAIAGDNRGAGKRGEYRS